MDIKLPQTINDCDLLRLAKWSQYAADIKDMETLTEKLEFRVEVVSIFSGKRKQELNRASVRDINKAFVHCIDIITQYSQKEPKGVIEADGVRYVFDKDIHNTSTGQVIDIKLIENIFKQPYEVMATLYVEEGYGYEQTDEQNRVVNPRSKRVDIFKQHPIGEEFLNVLSFFLTSYIVLNLATQGMMIKQRMMKKKFGRLRLMMNGMIGRLT